MEEQFLLDGEPELITPDSITNTRLKDLEFFKNYVTEDHKSFISKQY